MSLIIWIINAIIEKIDTIIKAINTYMLVFVSAFISGELRPSLTHLILLGGSIAAEFVVAIGIILESPKQKAFREWFGMALVLGGVVVSAIFTISLFIFDEAISTSQQSKILALETQMAQRTLEGTNRRP